MRYPQGDLPILGAEIYDDNSSFGSSERVSASRKTKGSLSASRGSGGGPRKRPRTQAAEVAEAEDEKRRARGRPRVDTKDETAADTLEHKVQHLKDTNEDMSNAFMQLHDFALSSGLLDKMPEFGRQLRETTEKFVSLAREASDDDVKDDEPKAAGSNPTDSRPGSDRARSDTPEHSNNVATTVPPDTAPETTTEERPKALWGGLMLSYEPASEADLTPTAPVTIPQQTPLSSLGYEVVTYPTPENASFPFQPSPDDFTPLQDLPTPSPWLGNLAAPATYTAFETTFGRRLQRFSIERGLVLITMPNPPQSTLAHVFGFCLLLETPAAITRRLQRMLGHDVTQSLHNWEYPFFHLGGAGTHFSNDTNSPTTTPSPPTTNHSQNQRIGNQGTLDMLKPTATAGFATGPFSSAIGAIRDDALDRDMRIALPGYGGEYYDPDEVEVYLLQRGVAIPPGSDVVAVEVDLGLFSSSGGGGDGGGGGNNGSSGRSLSERQAQGVSAGGWAMSGVGGGGGDMVDPALVDVFAQGHSFMPPTTMAEASSTLGYASGADGSGGMLSFGALGPDGNGNSDYGLNATRQGANRQSVVVDVVRLVKEITKRGICLGRAPGFKQADIDAAFWRSVKVV
ncbi:hypothetical protein C8A00DRAFT_17877 [Chaetomidium leptoderma]|uniref:Uncharacterized protein n=1 Tax=Chaetomidium leptoderma TaxID=669021 RepID=A0AAN6VFP9_9PEZI|nr:hypothetical protein C8A00DRAFT_17877 [Chaetomidium leptoderma]